MSHSFCAICHVGFGNAVHLSRHVQVNHHLNFWEYDWYHVQKHTEAPMCKNCKRPFAIQRRGQQFCGFKCSTVGHTLSERGRLKVAHRTKETKTTHGHTTNRMTSPTYKTWENMLSRCRNPKHNAYKNYGGRGIRVCQQWLTFEHFLTDMGERPAGMSIDRYPDNDGDYRPGNCRWATRKQQNANRRKTAQPEMTGHG